VEGDSLQCERSRKDADGSEGQEDIPRSGAEDLALNLAERNCLSHFPANYGVIIVAKCSEVFIDLVERWNSINH